MSISVYFVFIRYDLYGYMISKKYLLKYSPIKTTIGQIKANDSSQITKEKSLVVSKFGLDFELFYNVRNALRLQKYNITNLQTKE